MNALTILQAIGLFLLAGVCEISGGWLVWQYFRSDKYHIWFYLLTGFMILCVYGLVPVLQPSNFLFNRTYAVYGGFFIILSLLWGWALDNTKPDIGDWIGSSIGVAGVMVMLFWPR